MLTNKKQPRITQVTVRLEDGQVREMSQWEIQLGPEGLNWFGHAALRAGASLRVTLPLREHKRRRINKKWLRRYGTYSFSIPSEVIQEGTPAVRACIYREMRAARRVAAFLRRSKGAVPASLAFKDVDPSEQRLMPGVLEELEEDEPSEQRLLPANSLTPGKIIQCHMSGVLEEDEL